MGNSTSDIVSRVSGMSLKDLEKSSQQDIDLLENPAQVFDSLRLAGRNDLTIYNVSLTGKAPPTVNQAPVAKIRRSSSSSSSSSREIVVKKAPITADLDESLICSQDLINAARERQSAVISSLIADISTNTDLGLYDTELTTRSKGFCRMFEAVIRSDKQQQLQETNKKKCTDPLSIPSKNQKEAMQFSVDALMHLIKLVAKLNPDVCEPIFNDAFELIINSANEILDRIPIFSLEEADPILMQSINEMSRFFSEIASENLALSQEIALQSFGPLFKIALSSGSLNSFLGLAEKLLAPSTSTAFWKIMIPLLQTFNSFPKSLHDIASWDLQKLPKDVILEQNTLHYTGTKYAMSMLNGRFSVGQHYFEFIINIDDHESGLGICCSKAKTIDDFGEGIFNSSYSSCSKVRINGGKKFKFEKWKVNDRIGIFLDMDRKELSYFRNGRKHKEEALTIEADEVKVIFLCRGEGSVTLCSNLNYPSEIQSFFHHDNDHETTTVIETLLAQQ